MIEKVPDYTGVIIGGAIGVIGTGLLTIITLFFQSYQNKMLRLMEEYKIKKEDYLIIYKQIREFNEILADIDLQNETKMDYLKIKESVISFQSQSISLPTKVTELIEKINKNILFYYKIRSDDFETKEYQKYPPIISDDIRKLWVVLSDDINLLRKKLKINYE
jgi:hypothetical protein